MEDNKFFRLIWRFNALVIMSSGLLTIVVLLFAAVQIFQESFGNRQVNNIVNVAQETKIKETYSIRHFREVSGTPYLIFSLSSNQSYRHTSYSSKSTAAKRNYLFVNSKTNSKQWLFLEHKNLIVDDYFIVDETAKNKLIKAILYTVVTKDTNQDSRLTSSDLITIAIGDPSGEKYQEIVTDVKFYLGFKNLEDDQILVIYDKNDTIYSVKVDIDDFVVSQASKISKIQLQDE